MHEDMRLLLNAYLDGELHGIRLLEMQTHLASCAVCRNELKDLRRVSELLQAAPPPQVRPVERFVSNLVLNLPRRSLQDRPPRPGSLLWWVVPAGLLGLWYFVRTAFAITSAVSLADTAGLLGQAQAWLSGVSTQALWFSLVNSLMGGTAAGSTQSTLNLLNTVDVFGTKLVSDFLWQAAIVLLYWGWLAAWWLKRRPQPMRITAKPATS